MKIALIFPPYSHKVFSENLSTVDEEFCLAPPIILAYVAAILERHGHKVILVDARALNLTKEEALERIKNFGPDILGFRAETYHFHDALEWVDFLKRSLGVPVIAGGINLSLYPKETLSHPEIDYGVIGEATGPLPKLLRALENNDEIDSIPGIVYRREGQPVINQPKEEHIEFDDYPFPARHLLPNDVYYSFISQLRNFTIMLASTGCPFRCTFCAIHSNTKCRLRSAASVVDEIEICCKEFNIREIDFFDAVFFLDKKRLSEIFSEIKKRRLKIEWSCRSRVDVVDNDILREAARVGCRQIYYGIESVDRNILEAIKKDVKVEQVKQAVKWSKKHGIRPMGFFMVGNPCDTEGSVRRTIEFSKTLGLDFIQVCRTVAKPGTDLDKTLIEKTGKDYWRDHVLGKKITGRLPTPWSELSGLQVEALTKEFYLKFYFRPKILLSRILQLKSLREFKRYITVGWKMLLQKSELRKEGRGAKVALFVRRYYHLAGIIILAVILTKIDVRQMFSQFSKLNIAYFLLINLLILPSLFLKAWRWRYLLKLQGIDYSIASSFTAYLGGIFAGIITPGRIGEVAKAAYLKEDKDIRFSEGIASIFVDRVFDVYLLVLLGTIGSFYFLSLKTIKPNIFIYLGALFMLLVPFLLLNKALLERFVKGMYRLWFRGLDKDVFDGQFRNFFSAVKKIIAGRIYPPFVFSIGAYIFYFYQCYLLARLAHINMSPITVMSIVSISTLVSLLPITILGIGTREASLVFLFTLIGLSAESAIVYSFMLFLSFYVFAGLLAYAGWLVKGRKGFYR